MQKETTYAKVFNTPKHFGYAIDVITAEEIIILLTKVKSEVLTRRISNWKSQSEPIQNNGTINHRMSRLMLIFDLI